MSLLLSVLGTAAIATSTISAPVVATQTTHVDAQKVKAGFYDIKNGFVKSEVTALGGSGTHEKGDVQRLKVLIPWRDLKVSPAAHAKINWEESQIQLNFTLSYANNVWSNQTKPVDLPKTDVFSGKDGDLGIFFSQERKYDDNANINGFNRFTHHDWQYTFNDRGNNLEINATVVTSATDALAWSYASINFESLYYNLVI